MTNRPSSKNNHSSRRSFIKLGVLLTGSIASGHFLYKNRHKIETKTSHFLSELHANKPVNDDAISPVLNSNEKNYSAFIENLHLRYITPSELIRAHHRVRNGIYNQTPPKELWNKLVPTLQVADELRHRLNCKLTTIVSAYRSPQYNKQCPGASSKSYHLKNKALDLMFTCSPKIALEEVLKMRKEGIFSGGVGLYHNFIHIDTRGYNTTWGLS